MHVRIYIIQITFSIIVLNAHSSLMNNDVLYYDAERKTSVELVRLLWIQYTLPGKLKTPIMSRLQGGTRAHVCLPPSLALAQNKLCEIEKEPSYV